MNMFFSLFSILCFFSIFRHTPFASFTATLLQIYVCNNYQVNVSHLFLGSTNLRKQNCLALKGTKMANDGKWWKWWAGMGGGGERRRTPRKWITLSAEQRTYNNELTTIGTSWSKHAHLAAFQPRSAPDRLDSSCLNFDTIQNLLLLLRSLLYVWWIAAFLFCFG